MSPLYFAVLTVNAVVHRQNLDGLGEMFGVSVDVRHTLNKSEGADHDEFMVSVMPATNPLDSSSR